MTEPLTPIFRFMVQVTFHLTNLLALHLLLRGHHAPGGGFIAGVCTAISLILLSLAITVEEARRVIRWRSARIAATGGAIAVATAAAPLLWGRPLLEHYHFETAALPLLGRVELSTTLLFDIGIYLIVAGVAAKLLFTFGLSTAGQPGLVAGEEELFSAAVEEPVEEGQRRALDDESDSDHAH